MGVRSFWGGLHGSVVDGYLTADTENKVLQNFKFFKLLSSDLLISPASNFIFQIYIFQIKSYKATAGKARVGQSK